MSVCLRMQHIIMPPPPQGGGIKRCCVSDVCLSDVCLSIAYIGPKSRTEKPRNAKIGTEVVDSDTTFKVKRSKVNLRGGHIVAVSCTACYSIITVQ